LHFFGALLTDGQIMNADFDRKLCRSEAAEERTGREQRRAISSSMQV
jgi:hypothetical protein